MTTKAEFYAFKKELADIETKFQQADQKVKHQ